ncbi:MAG: Methyltransferase type 12 [Verrucomicrobiales bacterium]|nr:Methyltransferase type 12 [Verrucomicrobiales bacterium]
MSFDLLAPYYRSMERVLAGSKLQRCRLALLEEIQKPTTVLLMGEGHGRFLPELMRRHPSAQITCLDASSAMIGAAQISLRREGLDPARVEWLHADAMEWIPPAQSYDLVVTHFFLDCFTADQLDVLIGRISSALKPQAEWLFSDFRVPPDGFTRLRAQIILWLMYRFFRRAAQLSARTLVSPVSRFHSQGFVLRQERIFEWGLLHAQLWQRVR